MCEHDTSGLTLRVWCGVALTKDPFRAHDLREQAKDNVFPKEVWSMFGHDGPCLAAGGVLRQDYDHRVCVENMFLHQCDMTYRPAAEKVATICAAYGYLPLLARVLRHHGPFEGMWPVLEAARHGRVDCLVLLLDAGCFIDPNIVVDDAARHGQLQTLRCLYARGYRSRLNMPAAAMEGGSAACLAYVLDNGSPCDEINVLNAIRYKRVDFVRILCAHGAPWDADIFETAVSCGGIECVAYFLDAGCSVTKSALCRASIISNVAMLRLLHAHGSWGGRALPDGVLLNAAAALCVDVMRYALDTRKYTRRVLRDALSQLVTRGGPELVNMLCDYGARAEPMHVNAAAEYGNAAVLRVMLERGGVADAFAIAAAVRRHRRECVKVLLEFNCPVSVREIKRLLVVDSEMRGVRTKLVARVLRAVKKRGWELTPEQPLAGARAGDE